MFSVKEQCIAAFVLFLLINSQTVYAFQLGEKAYFEEDKEPNESKEKKKIPRTQFECNLEEMSASDSQNFLELLRDGFLGSEYGNNVPPKKQREKLENSTVIIPIDKEKGTAQKVNVADEKFDTNEAQHILNDWIQGPFSYGLVLTDTLRVGRCIGLKDHNIPCPLEGKQLSLRNSGTGFTSDFKPIGEFFGNLGEKIKTGAITVGERAAGTVAREDYNWVNKEKENWTDQDYEKMRQAMGLPENAEESLKEYAASSDLNESEVHTMKRTIQQMISNSILADDFYAYSQTTCNTSDCIINVYSLFDKYYNNWFSVDIVFSLSGPVLLSRAKKLFMNIGRRGTFPWRFSDSRLMNAIRKKFYHPDSYLYDRLSKRMWHRSETIPEVGKLRFELMETQGWQDGMYLTKSRPFRNKFEKEWMAKGGWFDKITDGRIQKEMYQFSEDVRKWQKIHQTFYNEAKEEYMKAFNKYGMGSAQEQAARMDFGQRISKLMTSSEDAIHLDLPEWVARDGSAKLYKYAVKANDTDATRWLAHDSIDMFNVMKKFEADGHWGGSWGKLGSGVGGFESSGRNLNLYAWDPKSKRIGSIKIGDLDKHFSNFEDLFVKTDPGDVMPIKSSTVPYLKKSMTGTRKLYAGQMDKVREISPEEFSQRLVNNRRLGSFFEWYGPNNAERVVYGLQSKGFMKRRYTSLLDRAMMNQDELLKNYFGSPKGAAKWTAYFNTYWFAKRGLGQEEISGYMLPDSWREIRWPIGSDKIYNDAFIDFFAHAGSDQGDMFRRVINHMPWEWVGSQLLANYKPAYDIYQKFTNQQMRNEVENIAFYGSTQQECNNCGVSLDSERGFQSISSFFFSSERFKAYMVEDVVSEKAKKKGTTLITFAHHTNLEGKEKDVSETGEINIKEAIADQKTCYDKVNKLADKIPFGLGRKAFVDNSQLFKPHTVGGMLAFGESVLYATAFWAGVFGSVLQQVAIAPKVQDCVDADEGYYTHIFAPAQEEKTGKENEQVLSTEKAMNLTEGFSEQLFGMFKSDTNSYTAKAAEKLDQEVKNFFESAKQNDIVQATVELPGYSSGKLDGEKLFSFWFKGETSPLEYKTEGMKKIGSKDGNRSVIVDFKNGRVYVVDQNGNLLQELTDNNYATASSSTNTRIPAEEFGKRFTLVGLPESKELLFEMNTDGDLTVKIPEVIDCILQGIEFQSGIEARKEGIGSLNLTPVFGEVQSIVTDSHPAIRAWSEDQKIVAEGSPRLTMEGSDSMVKMFADRNTYLWNQDENRFVGLLKSVQLKNGVILYKPDTHELLIWLKRHELGQLSSEDVGGARFKPTTSINPETDCPEPAVDLEVLPSTKSGTTAFKVDAFNKALGNVGPFTVLETPKRRFIFYSKYEPDGECVGIECCKDYFRVIDKETGEVYDAPIEELSVTPDGIKVKDAKGKEHNLGLDAKNGVPTITYNNYPPEPLTSAQGRNGSFWYDPETGLWNAENAQLLPLLEAFKNGSLTKVGPDGQVVSKPGDNIMNIQAGVGDDGLLNLPSLPENKVQLFLFFFSLITLMYALVYRKKFAQNNKQKTTNKKL